MWDQTLSFGYNNTDSGFAVTYYWTTVYLTGDSGVTESLENRSHDARILPTDYSPGLPAYASLPVVAVSMGFYSLILAMEFSGGLGSNILQDVFSYSVPPRHAKADDR